MPAKQALLIGNSDGIGLATTRELLKQSWQVTGISRSESSIKNPAYQHYTCLVQDPQFLETLKSVIEKKEQIDLCIYCAGIGELLDPTDMKSEVDTLEVNLLGMVKTASAVIPSMVRNGKGHFIGISSVADVLLSEKAPGYHASKAGFSNYLESLAMALRPRGIFVTNVRFGFVDTKLAKGDVKPFMMGTDRAVHHLMKCIKTKPIQYTAPRVVIPLVRFRSWALKLKVIFS
jgi:short-subunit dehydrogenase